MINNEPIAFLKDLIPPLTPALILGAFAFFVIYTSKPTAPVVAPLLPESSAVEIIAFTQDWIQPTGPFFTEAHWN